MTFQTLAQYWQKLEQTASRNLITEIFAELLSKADPQEIDKICYLSLGQLAPAYVGVEFNLAEKMMIRVVARAFGIDVEEIRYEFKQRGDLGEVVYQSKVKSPALPAGRQKLKIKSLTILEVYQRLFEVASESGGGSAERKIEKMSQLLVDLDHLSAKYVARIPLGKLRLGFSELTILDALSWMITKNKSKREAIEAAYNVRADVGQIAYLIKSKGIKGLGDMRVGLGIPIMPALCQRLPTVEEIIKKMGQVAVEPKYDGTRLQMHFRKGEAKESKIVTRNLENVTDMFPDLLEAGRREIQAREVILDGEAIGFDPKTDRFLPFQETIKRKRKYLVRETVSKIPLKYFVFDILFKDGDDLLGLPFNQRREILTQTLSFSNKTLILSPQILTENPDELRQYHDEQIKKGLEGVVVKKWQAPYDPGRRGYTWVKLKQEKGKKGGGLADTLDCVVMGYYQGRGKRASFGIGAFLVGIRKSQPADLFLTISKIGTGLTDEQWRELKVKSARLPAGQEKLKVSRRAGSRFAGKSQPKEYLVDKNLTPDVWCAPGLVVEIEADNITQSPIHTAGFALRFPRLVRLRDDKSPDQATTLKEVKRLYELQK